MKSGIHPKLVTTKITCSGCGTSFESRSTVPEINVEICSNCHPFYTGKQKLVDTAGRVDRFRARSAAAHQLQASRTSKKAKQATKSGDPKALDEQMREIGAKVQAHEHSTTNEIGSIPDLDNGTITPTPAIDSAAKAKTRPKPNADK